MNSALVPGGVREARLEQMMRAYENAVLRLCFLYLSDRALAEDASQDTFMKVWRSMDQFERRNDCSEKTWIMRIAVNTCKDYRRAAWFRHVDAKKAAEDILPALRPVPEETREILQDVLAMPAKYKEPILLYYYQNMSMEEAAKALGISRPTFYRRLQKAHSLLRYELKGEESDEGYPHSAMP